jgi:hypothetical protein
VRIEVGTRRNKLDFSFFTTKTRKYETTEKVFFTDHLRFLRAFVLSRFRGEKAFDLFFCRPFAALVGSSIVIDAAEFGRRWEDV